MKNRPQTQPQNPASLVHRQVTMSGPLPHPEILAGMEKVLPGAANRVVTMAEQAQVKSLEMEAANIDSIAFTRRMVAVSGLLGVALSFLVVAGLGAAFFFLTFRGYQVQGGLSGLAALAYAILVNQRRKKNTPPPKQSQSPT